MDCRSTDHPPVRRSRTAVRAYCRGHRRCYGTNDSSSCDGRVRQRRGGEGDRTMNLSHLLVDTFVHMPPAQMLADLTEADAARKPEGAPHSIVEIIAHLDFWQS